MNSLEGGKATLPSSLRQFRPLKVVACRSERISVQQACCTKGPSTFSPPPRVSDPDTHHGTCVTHVPRCMPGSQTSGFHWSQWRGKHCRRMRNPQFFHIWQEAHVRTIRKWLEEHWDWTLRNTQYAVFRESSFTPHHWTACRTYLIAKRFWVVVICPIIKCLYVLEFSFILFDLCLFITIFNFILNYVPIETFWIFTYHKIWILLIIFCFIWNYWIIYFFNMFGSVLGCCELTGVSLLWPWLIKWK